MARNVLLRLTGDSTSARKAVEETRNSLRELARTQATARVDIRTEAAKAQLERLNEQLQALSRQEASPAVKIRMGRTVEQIDRLELKLAKLDRERVNVKVDIDRTALSRVAALERHLKGAGSGIGRVPLIGAVLAAPFALAGLVASGLKQLPALLGAVASAASSAFSFVTDAVRGLLSGTTTIGQVLGSLASGLVNIATSGLTGLVGLLAMIPVLALLAVALSAVTTAILALVGALGALVASLALAAGGLAAVLVGGLAAAIPILLVVAGLVQRFVAVLGARKAAEQATTQALQQQKAAEQQRKAALDASRQAQQQLADATVAGRKAMAQSAVDLQHAELGLASSKLGIKDARLNLLQARKDLKDLLKQAGAKGPALGDLTKQFTNVDFHPGAAAKILGEATGGSKAFDPLELQRRILAVQRAQLNLKESTQGAADAQRTLNSAAAAHLDFMRRGLQAYAPYRAALHGVEQAQRRLAQATARTSAAQVRYQEKLKGLSATEKGFLGTLDPFLAKLKSLASIVTQPIFAGMQSALASISKLLGDSKIRDGLQAIGTAIGGFIAAFAKDLTTERWRSAIVQFEHAAVSLLNSGGRAIRALFSIFMDVAKTALPAVVKFGKDAATALTGVASHHSRIHTIVKALIGAFRTWLSIAGHLVSIVVGFLKGASGSAGTLSGYINHLVAKFDHWINSKRGMRDVREFLRKSVAHVKSMGEKLPGLLKQFMDIAKVVGTIAADTIKVVQWLGNARRNTEHALLGSGSLSPTELASSAAAAKADLRRLGTHLSPEDRRQTRLRLEENLQNLVKHWVTLSPSLKAVLKHLQHLDLTKGLGSSLQHSATAHGGRQPVRSPDATAHGAGAGQVHHHFAVHGITDPRVLAHKLAREVGKRPEFWKGASRTSQELGLAAP